MFSSSIFKTKESFHKFNEDVENTKYFIKQKMNSYKNHPIIVLTGMMGVGKSSLTCCLLKKSLIVKATGKTKYLVGEGVGIGLNACTTKPSINFDSNNQLVIVDLPGFEDNRNYEQEILNSIAIDSIFDISPNHQQNYKIILVITSFDFQTNRCKKLIDSFTRLKRMLPQYEQIKNTIGIIITKGDNDFEAKDYIDFFNDIFIQTINPNSEMFEVHKFINKYIDNIFVFSQPLDQNIEKQYEFNDYERLLTFLKTNFCQNPEHKIIISDDAESNLVLSYEENKKNTLINIKEIFQRINSKYRCETQSSQIYTWIRFIKQIMIEQIHNTNDFENIVKRYIPGYSVYDLNFSKLSEASLFDELILSVSPSHIDKSYLTKAIHIWCNEAAQELASKYKISKENEKIKQIQEERKRKEEEEEIWARKLKRQLEEQKEREAHFQNEIAIRKEREENDKRRKIQAQLKIRTYSGG